MNAVGPARDQYFTALAKVIDSGAATSTAALETAAQEVAKELAATHNLAPQDLFQLTPKNWLADPTGYGVKKEAEGFLAVAGVLNVPMATVSPIATRGVQSAKEMDLTILFNRSDAVKANPRPTEFLEEIDLKSTPPIDVMKKLTALFAHPRFADLYGARNHRQPTPPARSRPSSPTCRETAPPAPTSEPAASPSPAPPMRPASASSARCRNFRKRCR